MFSLVGSHIYLNRGDDCSFKIMYRHSSGEDLYNFEASDIITMTVKSMLDKSLVLTKVADSILVQEQEVSIFSFTYDDYLLLSEGDYFYDIHLDTGEGLGYTLFEDARMSVLKGSYVPTAELSEFETHRLVTYTTKSVYISETPLVCRFDHRRVEKVEAEGTLILFNKLGDPVVPSEGDDTLILFSQLPKEDSDDTLIIF